MTYRALALIAAAAMLLQACAPVTVVEGPKSKPPQILFPEPPDEPRFVFERMIMSSGDIDKSVFDQSVADLITGETNRDVGLGKPYAIAVRQGRIYVTDTVDREIKVFDLARLKFFTIQNEDEPIVKPLGIDVDASGRIYVADATPRVVKVFDEKGKLLRKIGEKQFDRLSSVTVDSSTNRVYVVDIGGVSSQNHVVKVFDSETGEHKMDIGKRGVGKGEFNFPRDVAIGKDGRIYVVDGGNFRVQVFDRDGKYLQSFGQVGRRLGDFARPKEIAIDKDGFVYVIDTAFGNFQIFNENGELMMFVGTRLEENYPAKYMLPTGIAVDEDGRVIVADQWFRKLEIFRPHKLDEDAGFLSPGSEIRRIAREREAAKKAAEEAAKKAAEEAAKKAAEEAQRAKATQKTEKNP